MNVTLVFFIIIGILIVILSTFTGVFDETQTEGYVNININEWDVNAMKKQISGMDYVVNDYSSHISMLINTFNAKFEEVVISSIADFDRVENGQCYTDDGNRHLYTYNSVGGGTKENNYNKCKQFAISQNKNTFGLQYGYQCFVGDTNDDMTPVDKARYTGIQTSNSKCNRDGFPDGTGSAWTQMIYKKRTSSTKLKIISDYRNIIQQFISSGLHNDADVMKTTNFNISPFTTIEGLTASSGFKFQIPQFTTRPPTQPPTLPPQIARQGIKIPQIQMPIPSATQVAKQSAQLPSPTPELPKVRTVEYISSDSKIKITNNNNQKQDIITNNIIDIILNKNFKIETTQFNDLMDTFKSSGKSIDDFRYYIDTLKKFGINSEYERLKMITKLTPYCSNGTEPFADLNKLINLHFKNYQILNINALLREDAWFLKTVDVYKLHKLQYPLLPSTVTNATTISVMGKLLDINGSIQTMGNENMNTFFSQFASYGVDASTFFNKIYPIYSDKSLEIYNYNTVDNVNPLVDVLYKISGFSNSGLIDAFVRLKEFLGPNGLKLSFNQYITFINSLKSRVMYDDLSTLWSDFKTYYEGEGGVPQSNITTNMLISWIDSINSASQKNVYFSNTKGDFNKYLKILIQYSYKTQQIISDIQMGQTYLKFLNSYSDDVGVVTKQGFTAEIENDSYFSRIYNYFFGENETEGMDGKSNISQSDTIILSSFGIKDFNNELKTIKNRLMKYRLQDVDKSKSVWKNMINVIDKLTKLQISINELDDFISLMNKFGAKTIAQWYDVLDILTLVKIKGYGNVSIFITLITRLGVNYQTNVRVFISKLQSFSADFSVSNFGPITKFVNDMILTGNKYDSPRGMNTINNIIDYFAKYGFKLDMYYSNRPISMEGCIDLPANYPSILVNTLYSYDKSVNLYKNLLNDIQYNASSTRMFNICDVVVAMQEAYMLCTLSPSYNNQNALITPNVALIAAFFYKEEMDAIISNSNNYSNTKMRVKLMDSIVDAIFQYANKLKSQPGYETVAALYNSLAKFIQVFPTLSFQYLSNEFRSKCINNEKCIYHISVNSDYSEAKASTTKKSINLRRGKPIV